MSGAEPWDNSACWNPHSDGGLLVLGGARACVSGVRVEPSSWCIHAQLEEENAQLLRPGVLLQLRPCWSREECRISSPPSRAPLWSWERKCPSCNKAGRFLCQQSWADLLPIQMCQALFIPAKGRPLQDRLSFVYQTCYYHQSEGDLPGTSDNV